MFNDAVVNTIHPTKRSTAFALSIFLAHLLGDSGSPYAIGILSDALSGGGGGGAGII